MTREENLHWLNKEIETWENECQSKHPIKEALYAARKALEQEPRWIPITEKLPEVEEEATRCLATVDVGGSFDDYTAIRTYFSDTKDFNDIVTAWMPLPEPYKAESEAEDGNVD